jgi:hypothetical protein
VECADLSALWSPTSCRGRASFESKDSRGDTSPKTKAVTGHRTPNCFIATAGNRDVTSTPALRSSSPEIH